MMVKQSLDIVFPGIFQGKWIIRIYLVLKDLCISFHLASCRPFPNILHIVQVHSLHESFVVPSPEFLNS